VKLIDEAADQWGGKLRQPRRSDEREEMQRYLLPVGLHGRALDLPMPAALQP
jgi:hypothetical protein